MISKDYKIVEVVDKNTETLFLYGTNYIYNEDSNWVPVLDVDIKNHFNVKKNILLEDGKAKRWIIVDDENKVLGRISAFFHPKKANVYEQPTGGLGFFECIDDFDIASLLFDTAIHWLKEFGMEAVDGPINLGENFINWGMLYEGHVQQMYGMQYHPKYYKKLFETYGFKIFYKQFTYRIKPNEVSPRILKIGKWVDDKKRFTARHFRDGEKVNFSNDLAKAFNVIWSSFKEDFTDVTGNEILKILEDAKFILDPKLVWVIYDKENPIAVAVMIPDVNQIIKKTNGKMSLVNIIKLLYYRKKKVVNRIRSIIIGVAPDYQKQGVEALIFHKVGQVFDRNQYTELEFSWIGDFNLKMQDTIKSVGAKKVSTHVTYRYLFDRNKKFVRYPIDNYLEKD